MIDYKTEFVNTDGVNFPNTKSVNASGPSATDGTELVKLLVDDLWGRTQALMDYAGLTPDSVTESPANSQHIESIQKGFAVGPGIGVTWWKNSDPSVTGDRVLFLNGQGVLIATYPELTAAVYVGDGNNGTASFFYKADDAAGTIRNIAGIYLILPESRGYALRGLDPGASVDPDGASRDLGNVQLDAFQGHSFGNASGVSGLTVDVDLRMNSANAASAGGADTTNRDSFVSDSAGVAVVPVDDGTNGTPRVEIESRMVNIATKFGITY